MFILRCGTWQNINMSYKMLQYRKDAFGEDCLQKQGSSLFLKWQQSTVIAVIFITIKQYRYISFSLTIKAPLPHLERYVGYTEN
jgi:hypothetical protein